MFFCCFFFKSWEIEDISIHLFVKVILNNAKIIHRSKAIQYDVSKLTFLLKIQNNYVSSLVSNAIQFDSIFSLKQTDNDPRYSKVALQPEMCFSSAPHSWTLELQTVFTFIPQSVNLPCSYSKNYSTRSVKSKRSVWWGRRGWTVRLNKHAS